MRIGFDVRLMMGVLLFLGLRMAGAEDRVEGSWTAVVIPDTQYYVQHDKNAPIFAEIGKWIADQKDERNIQLVLHLGDIVNYNTKKQWTYAKNSLKQLDGVVPYVLAVGNHDLGKNASDRSTMLNQYFKISDNPLNEKIFGGYFEEGKLENAWYRFKYGTRDYIIFSLEFGPRKEVVQWANGVARQYPEKSMLLVTHDFIDQESALFSEDGWGRRTKPSTKNNPHSYGIGKGGNALCGEELWDQFVSMYSNFDLVLNGHYKPFIKTGPKPNQVKENRTDLTTAYRNDQYADGRTVHQLLFNAQWAPKGGDGWIRLLEFLPDGKTVQVKTYSPYRDRTVADKSTAWRKGPAWEFKVELPPAPVKP